MTHDCKTLKAYLLILMAGSIYSLADIPSIPTSQVSHFSPLLKTTFLEIFWFLVVITLSDVLKIPVYTHELLLSSFFFHDLCSVLQWRRHINTSHFSLNDAEPAPICACVFLKNILFSDWLSGIN